MSESVNKKTAPYSILFGKDCVGSGDHLLGNSLAKMMLYTLSEDEEVPESIIFINDGVKLAVSDKLDVIRSLSVLEEKGTEILISGTCLNYYGLTAKVKTGTISSMADILERLKKSPKIITV